MKTPIFTGSGLAMITPMNADGSVNYAEIDRILEDQLANHTDAILSCGTTGEASTLEDEEHLQVIKHVVKRVNGRVPVIAGTGSNNTAHAVMMSKGAADLGADALLVVTPYYNKTSQAGLIASYTAVADATELPVIMYNVPSRTGVNIAPETAYALSAHPKINAIKEAKAGKIEYRLDKTNIIHCPIGKVSFGAEKLTENYNALIGAIIKAKPAAAKGQYIKSCVTASTMGPGIKIVTKI